MLPLTRPIRWRQAMARRTVVEVQCSRCDRKELVESAGEVIATNGLPPGPAKALIVKVSDGTNIEFEDLCSPCMGAVKGHLEAIGKKIEGLSPERKKTKDPATEAVVEEVKKEREAKKKGPEADPSSTVPSSSSTASPRAPRAQ